MPTDTSSARPDTPPVLQGRYTIYRTLEESERGALFLGFDQRLQRLRAIEVPANDEFARQLREESELLARLEHPAVERVIDVGEHGPISFVVRDRLQGSVSGHIPLRPSIAAFVVLRIAEGLAHAHARNILHGDLRPSYIRFSDDGSPVLTGFGRALAGAAEPTPDGPRAQLRPAGDEVKPFLAPEVRDGAPTDVRSEVYSLGALLYTLVTGRESAELCYAEASDGLLSAVPGALRSVILRSCAHDPNERPANVDGFRMLLAPRTESLGSIGEMPWRTSGPPEPRQPEFVADATLIALHRVLTGATPMPTPAEEPFTIDSETRPPPYRMPERPIRRTTGTKIDTADIPDYIDPEHAAGLIARPPVTVRATGVALETPAPARPREKTAERERNPNRGFTLLTVFAASFAAVLLVLAALGWMGGAGARRDSAFVEAVRDEGPNVSAIAEASADQDEVVAAWRAFQAQPGPESAKAFVETTLPAADRITTRTRTKEAIDRLEGALIRWRSNGEAPAKR